jgi:hypothetical protein
MGARVFPIRIAFGVLWLLAVGAGFVVMFNYQNASGRVGLTPQHWPAGTRLTLDHAHNTLIMFAHPQCPCTRASLEELNRLLARSQGRVAAQVLFFKPGKFTDDWTRTGLWRSAAAIPGVTVHEDLDGAQARLFGAETSGYVLLYDTHGQLLFRGGITGDRGHAGDNAGENAVVSLLAGQNVNLKQTPVYGCSLLGSCEMLPEGTAK